MAKREYKKVNYEDIRTDIQTGDLLIFDGDGLVSNVIKWSTKSSSSHIGVAYRDIATDIVYIFESTTLIRGVKGSVKGVNMIPLSTRLKAYNRPITWRKLNCPRTPEFHDTFKEFRAKHRNKLYEQNILELALSAVDPKMINVLDKLHNKDDDSTLFCSELVALLYKAWGFLPKDLQANEITPADCDDYGIINTYYTQDDKWSLDEQLQLVI